MEWKREKRTLSSDSGLEVIDGASERLISGRISSVAQEVHVSKGVASLT